MATEKRSGRIENALAVVTVLMTIIFVISLISFILIIRARNYYEPVKVNSFVYDLRDNRYADIIDSWHENMIMGVDSEEYAPYYAMAEYCEKASYYKVYKDKGDEARCEEILSQMKETVPDLKEAKTIIGEINKTFGIPET